MPILHGYVSTTAKPRADVVLKSDKDEPVLAVWQYGLGRTAAWTSDLSGQWTSDWIASDEGMSILRNLISYSMTVSYTHLDVYKRQDDKNTVDHIYAICRRLSKQNCYHHLK